MGFGWVVGIGRVRVWRVCRLFCFEVGGAIGGRGREG